MIPSSVDLRAVLDVVRENFERLTAPSTLFFIEFAVPTVRVVHLSVSNGSKRHWATSLIDCCASANDENTVDRV